MAASVEELDELLLSLPELDDKEASDIREVIAFVRQTLEGSVFI
jgi:hypothetical protein